MIYKVTYKGKSAVVIANGLYELRDKFSTYLRAIPCARKSPSGESECYFERDVNKMCGNCRPSFEFYSDFLTHTFNGVARKVSIETFSDNGQFQVLSLSGSGW